MPETRCDPSDTQTTSATTRVASSVMRVTDVDRSARFYCDVFGCEISLREPDAALLLAPDGFQIYLYARDTSRRRVAGPTGVQYLMWSTESEAELERITSRMLAHDPATYSHTENDVTFVEGCDPDHGRVIVAYPGPSMHPRQLIAPRFRGH